MAPKRCFSTLVNIKLKEVTVELIFKGVNRVTLDHWRWELIPFSHYNVGEENLVQSEFTCLHLSFMPLFLVRKVSSIINNFVLSTFVKPLSFLKHSISFPRRRRFSSENMLAVESLSS